MAASSHYRPTSPQISVSAALRSLWAPLIVIDLILLVCLAKITLVAVLVLAAVTAVAFLRRTEWLLALMLYGMPLFDPLQLENEQASLMVICLRLFFCLGWVMMLLGGRSLSTGNSLFGFLQPVFRQPVTLCAILLPIWLWIGLSWTEAPEYGAHKLKSFLLANLFFYLAATMLWPIWSTRHRLDGFIRAGIIFGGIVAAVGAAVALGFNHELLTGTIGSHHYAAGGRLAWLGTNSIWLARIVGAWCVLLLWGISRKQVHPLIGGILVVVGLMLVIRTGSRGPLVALFLSPLGLLLLPPYRPRGILPRKRIFSRKANRLLPVFGLIGVIILMLLLFVPVEQKATMLAVVLRSPIGTVLSSVSAGEDMAGLFGDQLLTDRSSFFRRGLIETALTRLREALPWGAGSGGFSVLLFGRDFRIYPHNLEIELLFENGWPGLLLFMMFMILIYRLANRLAAGRVSCVSASTTTTTSTSNPGAPDSTVRWLWVLFTMAFLNAQVSGDLSGNEHVWFWGGMIVALYICCTNRPASRYHPTSQ